MAMQPSYEERMYNLVSYMITSAANLGDEPHSYGPMRLVEAARRLLTILQQEGLSSPRLSRLSESLETGSDAAADSEEAMRAFLEALMDDVVAGFER